MFRNSENIEKIEYIFYTPQKNFNENPENNYSQ